METSFLETRKSRRRGSLNQCPAERRHKLRGTRRGAGGSMDLKRVKKEAAELEKDADSAGVTAKVRLRT
ncbi:MAG: hypothetical protein ACPIOQ_54455 [Promethearchaeia archaeon]